MSEEEIIKRLISKIEISKTIIETFEGLEDFDTCEREQEKIELLQATINLIDKLQKELDNSISKDIIRVKIKEAEKNYESCSKGNVVEKAYYRNKIDTLKELLGE